MLLDFGTFRYMAGTPRRWLSPRYATGKRAKQCGTRPPHGLNTAKLKHTCDSALQEGPECWIQRYQDSNTAHVGSSRDISLDTTAGSVRRCCAVHAGGSAYLPMFQEHGQCALQACCPSAESHPHEQARKARSVCMRCSILSVVRVMLPFEAPVAVWTR